MGGAMTDTTQPTYPSRPHGHDVDRGEGPTANADAMACQLIDRVAERKPEGGIAPRSIPQTGASQLCEPSPLSAMESPRLSQSHARIVRNFRLCTEHKSHSSARGSSAKLDVATLDELRPERPNSFDHRASHEEVSCCGKLVVGHEFLLSEKHGAVVMFP
jgi:hypothetical protein